MLSNFFFDNLFLHLWVTTGANVSLVKQVYSPRSLDQNRGNAVFFFKFLLGQFAFLCLGHSNGTFPQFLPRNW